MLKPDYWRYRRACNFVHKFSMDIIQRRRAALEEKKVGSLEIAFMLSLFHCLLVFVVCLFVVFLSVFLKFVCLSVFLTFVCLFFVISLFVV